MKTMDSLHLDITLNLIQNLNSEGDNSIMKEKAIVRSSNGNITINKNTGLVIEIEFFKHGSLPDISQFNLPKRKRNEYDILDLGFWLKNGKYIESFRNTRS